MGMILELTENEQITLLGLLEDISQVEDINEVFPIQARIAIKSIIQKLGGTYFGKLRTVGEVTDIRDIVGLWCDDITFCPAKCGWTRCPRNSVNIRDKSVPHSFSVEIPADCPMPDQKKIESIFFEKPID